MTSKKLVKDVIKMVDWAKRIEIAYRAIVRIIEQTRKYEITSTDYNSQLNAYYSMAKQMLDFNFEDSVNPEYKVQLDETFNKYLSDDAHWKMTQIKINEALNELTHFMTEFNEVTPSKEIEAEYLNGLIKPVNTLLAKYHKENQTLNGIVYELSYDAFSYSLTINGTKIYQAKDAGTQLALKTVFSQSGKEVQATDFIGSDGNPKKVNTTSIKNNIQSRSRMPESIYYLFKSFNSKKGIKIIKNISQEDLVNKGIDTDEINKWLNTKK